MTLQTFTVDVTELTPDEVVQKVNDASTQITRASSVASAARPIETNEVTTAKIADTNVTAPKLAAAAARDNLKAMSDVTREVVLTRPGSGEFPVTAVQRNTLGNLELEYDDVAIP